MPIEFIHIVRTPFMGTYFLYIHPFPSPPPPYPLLINFYSDSSFRHSQFSSLTISRLFSFSLVSEVKLHWNNIKKISMVSVYSLRPVYTPLYTMINGNVIASFVQKKGKFWDFMVRTYYVDDPIYRLKQ